MARRSLILKMEITTVGRAHDCRYNKRHRLEKGQRRLTIYTDGDKQHYCLACAKLFLRNDVQRLRQLLAEAEALGE